MTDASGSTTYCYDLRGNVIEKRQSTPPANLVTSFGYNLADRPMSITYPSGAVLTYTRDADGRIVTASVVPVGGSSISILTGVNYLPFGPATKYTFAAGTQVLDKAFDANYWMTDVTSNALDLHFRRDALGNIDRLGAVPGATPPTEQYVLDAHYRLEQVETAAGADVETYTYNKTGDRLSKTKPPAAAEIYGYQANTHRLNSVAGNARTFDANGNTTQTTGAATLTFGFDDRNRLTSLTRNGSPAATYRISGNGERVRKDSSFPTSDNRFFVYYGAGRILGEYTSDLQREYVWIDDAPVAILDTTGLPLFGDLIFRDGFEPATQSPNQPTGSSTTISYLHTDQLNSPRAVTSSTLLNGQPVGTAIWRWNWQSNPFGETAPDNDPDGNAQPFVLNLRLPGQYSDAESGLAYNYFRDYEPGTGRYVESDPIGLKGGISIYSYVSSQPLVEIDPTGESAAAAVGGFIAGDVAIPEPTDAAWPKWAAYGLALGGALLYDACTESDDEKKRRNCQALKDSILKTCYGLSGRKMFRCFEAANTSFQQCMDQD